MKILHVQNIQGIAGSENYLLALLPRLRAAGVETDFCLVHNKGAADANSQGEVKAFKAQLESAGVHVHLLEINSYYSPRVPFYLKNLCRDHGYELVHTHLIYADFWGALLKVLRPEIKVVSTKHGYQDELLGRFSAQPEKLPRNLYYRLFRFSESKLDASYACSNGLKNFLEKGRLVPKGKLQVVEHGFDYGAAPKPDLSLRYGAQQMTIVGRLLPRKGHRYALAAMHLLRADFPNLELVCCGDGPLRSDLEILAKNLGLRGRVHFTGFSTEAQVYQATGDLNLMPSLGEGLPLAMMEAFNSKRPVVAFDVLGCNDLIDHEQTGILVERENVVLMAEQIKRLLNSSAAAARLGNAAFKRLHSHFTLDRMLEETLALYKQSAAIAISQAA